MSASEEIVRVVLSGGIEAYADLISRHQNQVFGIIMRQTGDPVLARELTHETFVKAYQNLKSFRFESKFSTWVTSIALNVMRSYYGSRAYKESLKTDSLDLAPEGVTSSGMSHLKEWVRNAIGTLKDKHREVVVLCALEGYTHEEAATLLGVPVGTVASRMNTAFHLLRRKYERELI